MSKKKMRILVALGTRPELIKLGPLCKALERAGAELDVFWSGQHIELAEGLLELFDITVTSNGSDVMKEPGLAGKFGLFVHVFNGAWERGAGEAGSFRRAWGALKRAGWRRGHDGLWRPPAQEPDGG